MSDIGHTPLNTGRTLSALHTGFHAVPRKEAGGIITPN